MAFKTKFIPADGVVKEKITRKISPMIASILFVELFVNFIEFLNVRYTNE